jgi:DNA helicase-2/ATP-dependent DNA helicase PcrA
VFADDLLARDAREQRRLLHVAMTRPEDVLVLQGGSVDDEGEDNARDTDEQAGQQSDPARPMFDCVEETLPKSTAWQPGRGTLPVWKDLQDCLPPSSTDWTDKLAEDVVGDVGRVVTHGDDALSITEGRDRVLSLADRILDGSRNGDSANAVTDSPLTVTELTGPVSASPTIQHSYTSQETFETCPRQHYLDYVVNAFPDYDPGDDDFWDGVSSATSASCFTTHQRMRPTRAVPTARSGMKSVSDWRTSAAPTNILWDCIHTSLLLEEIYK